MTFHPAVPTLVEVANLIGLAAGGISMSIAVYLSFCVEEWVKSRYVFAFFVVGAYFVLAHTTPGVPIPYVVVISHILVGAIVLAAESYVFYVILRRRRAEKMPYSDNVEN